MPASLLTVSMETPLSVFAIFTFTAGIGAPDASLMVPVIVPDPLCAYTACWKRSTRSATVLKMKLLVCSGGWGLPNCAARNQRQRATDDNMANLLIAYRD